jgi:hypothetical protein
METGRFSENFEGRFGENRRILARDSAFIARFADQSGVTDFMEKVIGFTAAYRMRFAEC